MTDLMDENMAAACHACGGGVGLVKATAWKPGHDTRYFCHNSARSCYNDNRGQYFADEPVSVEQRTSADLDLITGAARSWLYELEAEIIPGAGSQEDRDGYRLQAAQLRAALIRIGVEV